jgi:Zn-finger nucleic acid-binding protein
LARCPECAGTMRFDPKSSRQVCQRCGLAVSRAELDRLWEEQRSSFREEDVEREKSQRRRDYLDWWLGKKEKDKRKK